MTTENKPSLSAQVVNCAKDLGVLLRLSLDPRQDPLFVQFYAEWRRRGKVFSSQPETLGERLKNTLNSLKGKQ